MSNIVELPTLIDELMDRRYQDPGAFEDFTEQLMTLGITRLSFDAFSNVSHFYTSTALVHAHIRRDLLDEQMRTPWILGDKFDPAAVENAIDEFDSRRISAIEFHKRLYEQAAIIFCHVFLTTRTIFYFATDGQYFREFY